MLASARVGPDTVDLIHCLGGTEKIIVTGQVVTTYGRTTTIRPALRRGVRVVCLRNNLACSACQRRPSRRSASSTYRSGYAFVSGPCEERRCRRIPHRCSTDRPLARDDGCTIAGCSSTYRLEVHHITERSKGGTDTPENLTTLCWWHHHVAVHRQGMHIDPNSPPHRRRLRPARNTCRYRSRAADAHTLAILRSLHTRPQRDPP